MRRPHEFLVNTGGFQKQKEASSGRRCPPGRMHALMYLAVSVPHLTSAGDDACSDSDFGLPKKLSPSHGQATRHREMQTLLSAAACARLASFVHAPLHPSPVVPASGARRAGIFLEDLVWNSRPSSRLSAPEWYKDTDFQRTNARTPDGLLRQFSRLPHAKFED